MDKKQHNYTTKTTPLTNQINKNKSEIQLSIVFLFQMLVDMGLKQSILHNLTDIIISPKLPPQPKSNSQENQISHM